MSLYELQSDQYQILLKLIYLNYIYVTRQLESYRVPIVPGLYINK